MARVHNIGFPGEPFKYLNKYKLLDWAKKKNSNDGWQWSRELPRLKGIAMQRRGADREKLINKLK